MAEYGYTNGVSISTSTGTLTGVTIGRTQALVLIGVGNSAATIDAEDPTPIFNEADVDDKFGAESDVAVAYRRALSNGVDPNYVQAVKASVTETTDSAVADGGTLSNTNIIPEISRISTAAGDPVSLSYETAPTADADSVVINPRTGYVAVGGNLTGVDITYETADWGSAILSAEDTLSEGEYGVINPLTTASYAVEPLKTLLTDPNETFGGGMRKDIKMAVGVLSASPTGDGPNGRPYIDPDAYAQTHNDDTIFVTGPTALQDPTEGMRGVGALPAVSGLMAGNDATEAIFDMEISDTPPLAQRLSRSDVTALRLESIMPLRDKGTIHIRDNQSTFDQTREEWVRDYFRRRIVDIAIAVLYKIARNQMGAVTSDETIEDIEDAVRIQMGDLVDDGLLEPGKQNVDVYLQADDRTVGIDAQITPYGIIKGAEVDLDIAP